MLKDFKKYEDKKNKLFDLIRELIRDIFQLVKENS